MADIHITTAQATDPDVAAMVREHGERMDELGFKDHVETPAQLSTTGALLWAAWSNGRVVGIVALLPLDESHGELTGMRTMSSVRRQGVGAALLTRLLDEASALGMKRVSLKVGADTYFEPARRLYERTGFQQAEPFGGHAAESSSLFMTIEL